MATERMNNEQKSIKRLLKKLSRHKLIYSLLAVFVLIVVGGAATLKASDNPSFCNSCHNMTHNYNTYSSSSSDLLAHEHAKAGVTCHDCHQDSLSTKVSEGVKYVTGNYEDPMKTMTFSKTMCLKCHDWKKVQQKTASLSTVANENPHNSEHGGQRECSQCHKVHEKSTNLCTKCHTISWENKLPSSWKNLQ